MTTETKIFIGCSLAVLLGGFCIGIGYELRYENPPIIAPCPQVPDCANAVEDAVGKTEQADWEHDESLMNYGVAYMKEHHIQPTPTETYTVEQRHSFQYQESED